MPYENDSLSLFRQKERRKRVDEFDLDDPDYCRKHKLDDKIKWRSLESGFPEEEIREALRNNRSLQWWFVNDPGRGSDAEEWARELIEEIPGVTKLVHPTPGTLHLVSVGSNAVVMTKQQLQTLGAQPNTKGIDFTWTYNGIIEFYATQKHTSGKSGGSTQQDKFDEMRDWIQIANENDIAANPNKRFIVLVDGSFWTDARIEDLRGYITATNVSVSRVIDLEGYTTQL